MSQPQSTRPSTPPEMASSRLSVSIWRSSRARLAPSAARTDNSRSRLTIRASRRLATEAQTISRTKLAVPSRINSVALKLRVRSSFSGVADDVVAVLRIVARIGLRELGRR